MMMRVWAWMPPTLCMQSGRCCTPATARYSLAARLRSQELLPLQSASLLPACLPAGLHIQELFPIQSVVWQQMAGGSSTAHDICIAAPTGSGKTLAYALPVICSLGRCAGVGGRGRRVADLRLVFALKTP